jgi:hypothetical protein
VAVNLSDSYVTLFDAEVHQVYQADAILRGTVRTRTGVNQSTYQWPKLGKGVASVRTPQSDVVPMAADWANVSVTMTDYIAAEYSDIFQQSHVNFQERQELAQMVGGAIARREDQIVVDAMIAATPGTTVANSVGGSATDMNIAKLRTASAALNAANAPQQDRYLLMHANALEALLSETSVTSSDFTAPGSAPLVKGMIGFYMGFSIIMMGDRDEDGLPKDGSNDRSSFAWHKNAVGLAVSLPQKTAIDYVPEKTSWLVAGHLSAGSGVIDTTGLVEIISREA